MNDSRMPDVVTAIRDSLNAHYKPAVVEWTVDVKGSAVTVPSITSEGFKTAGSGLFAHPVPARLYRVVYKHELAV